MLLGVVRPALKRWIMEYLADVGAVTRPEICGLTGIARTTVYEALEELEREGKVVRTACRRGGRRGRPPVVWHLPWFDPRARQSEDESAPATKT